MSVVFVDLAGSARHRESAWLDGHFALYLALLWRVWVGIVFAGRSLTHAPALPFQSQAEAKNSRTQQGGHGGYGVYRTGGGA